MTEQESLFFDLLVKRREQRAETINDPEFKSGFENNIDKYTDQAHFVYELLQNADDAGATQVRFLLEKDRLFFVHNGAKRFFVSNPDTVLEDKAAGKYGSVNAITAIGFSNKPEQNAIGKFGIGFMSVFQYTKTPQIFDANISFQIERLIVPSLIPDQPELRKPGEKTLFVFPFDSEKCSKEVSYSDIARKLRGLSYPLMFLNTLERIDYQIGEDFGSYLREPTDERTVGDISAKRMRFSLDRTQSGDTSSVIEEFWFFSRGEESYNRYSVCFAVEKDEQGDDSLKVFDSPAFCFFQTKSLTGLHFAIHAPFLLTDNRESIKAGIPHNKDMVNRLAELAADSLILLRDIGLEHGSRLVDDSILNIIPTSEDAFGAEDDTDKISFLPFFTAIREKLRCSDILPSQDGYVSRENAYWPETQQIAELITQKQLAALTNNPAAQWVFPKMGRNATQRVEFIKNVVDNKSFSNATIIHGYPPIVTGLSVEFFQNQSIDWLNRLYKWLLSVSGSVRGAAKQLKTMPIFRNRLKNAVAPYDSNGQHILFLNGNNDEKAICEEHLQNEDARTLLQLLDVGEVSPWDDLYNNVILPCAAKQDGSIAELVNFRKFFRYYCDAIKEGNEPKSLLDELKKHPCVLFRTASDQHRNAVPSTLYYPNAFLKKWFETKPDALFVDMDSYSEIEDTDGLLFEFLSALGVRDSIRIRKHKLKEEEGDGSKALSLGLHYPNSNYYITWEYPEIDGLPEVLNHITETHEFEKSKLVWEVLISLIEQESPSRLDYKLQYSWTAGKTKRESSPIVTKLRSWKWLKLSDGSYAAPQYAKASSLDSEYLRDSDAVPELYFFLRIIDDVEPEEHDDLTDEQRAEDAIVRIVREWNLTPDELEAILFERAQQKNTVRSERSPQPGSDTDSSPADSDEEKEDDRAFQKAYERQSSARKSVLRSLMGDRPEDAKDLDDEEEGDADEYTPPSIDYQKRIEREVEKGRREVEQIAREQELSERLATGKYTYGWFCALMDLEALSRNENKSGSREISISFGRVELEPGTERTLLLKQPSRYIPHWMEELASDIPLTIQTKGREHRIMIEVSSVKGYTLHTRLRNAEDIKKIDLNGATASISVQNPGFLLESLREGFAELDLPEDYDLKANLSENIKFVFGPPGTGKTTYLAREELIPLMRGAEDARVLVLAPTNKAADVLSMRIMELMGEDTSYENWLVRFGTTYDEKIEKSAIYRDRSFYLPKLRRYVLVTTIARFPYDLIGGKALRELDWDYVVIDEASMIPIANITYPLYKSKPKQFIIAGDPLQIQPVAQVESDENIYEMVGLKSFTNPRTEPFDYEVKLLTTQYRSVPSIGEVFSQFAYGGVLRHARTEDSRRRTNIDDIFEVAPLNIIKYPVSKYEGIYRAKRLGNTPYHVYSALLAHEFVAFLANKIGAANPDEPYSIGVISPYRAQADLIDRLLARTELPQTVSVQVGTIHGFQGDECNMIITVLNPPPTISDNRNIFLNKRNIINVSISRARDSLFVIMPDKETEHIERLRLVNKVERLIQESGVYREHSADEIETLLFGRTGFLEDNTFSTSHQNVNVYGLPEKRYEIRSEDTAIDVQIHEAT